MVDFVPVQVKVLEACQAMESAGANRPELIVIEQKRPQMVQMCEGSRHYFIDLVPAQVTVDNIISTLEKSLLTNLYSKTIL